MADGSAAADSERSTRDPALIARAALAGMSRCGVAPDPRNYAVWYAHCSKRRPDLSHAIERLTASGQKLTPAQNDDLYIRFLAGAPDAAELEAASDRLNATLQQVLGTIDDSRTATRDYGRTLATCSDRLEDGDSAGLRAAVARLATETRVMSERARALEEQLTVSRNEVQELRENLVNVQREALTDGLTEIANRKSFEMRLRHAMAAAMENGDQLSLLLLDIDKFKNFNDRYGHAVGDQVLRLVARSLTECVKGRDTAARYGGEEFAIILPNTNLAGAVSVAEEIRRLIMRRRIVRVSGGDVLGTITLSTGAATYRPGEPPDDFVQRADRALYLAKASGRNCVRDEKALLHEAAEAGTA
ncbi:MAG TPA: diguanylate cyclase [Stellaceae bacterium]|nr:diguanylate cyclase [Stellaceae bacterium]